jgi:hypothetical protein
VTGSESLCVPELPVGTGNELLHECWGGCGSWNAALLLRRRAAAGPTGTCTPRPGRLEPALSGSDAAH